MPLINKSQLFRSNFGLLPTETQEGSSETVFTNFTNITKTFDYVCLPFTDKIAEFYKSFSQPSKWTSFFTALHDVNLHDSLDYSSFLGCRFNLVTQSSFETINLNKKSLIRHLQGSFVIFIFDETNLSSQLSAFVNLFQITDSPDKLSFFLRLTSDTTKETLSNLIGYGLKGIIVNESIFKPNKAGFPTLPLTIQKVIALAMKHSAEILYEASMESSASFDKVADYFEFISDGVKLSDAEKTTFPYNDCYQVPLQPLKDNMSAAIYEAFELDVMKYDLYQEAIRQAIVDQLERSKNIKLVLIGGGNGGILKRIVSLVKEMAVESIVDITVVEKNKFAFEALVKLADEVDLEFEVILGDARKLTFNKSFSIIVSELLGSFGCNELSPECLEPLEKYIFNKVPRNWRRFHSAKVHFDVATMRQFVVSWSVKEEKRL